MPNAEIKFGTDGWRAIIAEDYTFENVRACAQGVANYLHDTGAASKGLVVGYDTRFGSEHFAAAVAEVVAANGIPVYLCDRPCPTPTASYSIIDRHAAGGVVITASHNPGTYNGFKYKPEYAGSASPEVVAELENRIAYVQRTSGVKRGQSRAPVHRINAVTPYMEHLAKIVDLEAIRRADFHIVADSMYGAGIGLFAAALGGGRLRVTELHAERNPAFPGFAQPEPIAHNLAALTMAIQQQRADGGLATDGDADRLGVMDEHGKFVTQLQTMALLALYFLDQLGQRGPLVKSISTTSMLFRMGELYGVPVHETGVGFKYVGPVMMRENALIGGEESGGYAFRGHIPERDGILSGLYILAMMARLNRRPSQLVQYLYDKVGPHYYDRWDLTFEQGQQGVIRERIATARPSEMAGTPVAGVDTLDGFRFRLKDGSWTLVRFSGTEPLLRIYCETSSEERVQDLLAATRRLTGV
jgi:phosphomannomutase